MTNIQNDLISDFVNILKYSKSTKDLAIKNNSLRGGFDTKNSRKLWEYSNTMSALEKKNFLNELSVRFPKSSELYQLTKELIDYMEFDSDFYQCFYFVDGRKRKSIGATAPTIYKTIAGSII